MSQDSPEFQLTNLEEQCGVSMPQVLRVRAQAFIFDNGRAVALPEHIGPATSGAVARLALGDGAEFSGLNKFGQPVYRLQVD